MKTFSPLWKRITTPRPPKPQKGKEEQLGFMFFLDLSTAIVLTLAIVLCAVLTWLVMILFTPWSPKAIRIASWGIMTATLVMLYTFASFECAHFQECTFASAHWSNFLFGK